jgi:LysM repeat protein
MKRNKIHLLGCFILICVLIILIITAFKQKYSSEITMNQDEYQVYIVQPGDTLWSIAHQYIDGDPRELIYYIQEINNVTPILQLGQELKIPVKKEDRINGK